MMENNYLYIFVQEKLKRKFVIFVILNINSRKHTEFVKIDWKMGKVTITQYFSLPYQTFCPHVEKEYE